MNFFIFHHIIVKDSNVLSDKRKHYFECTFELSLFHSYLRYFFKIQNYGIRKSFWLSWNSHSGYSETCPKWEHFLVSLPGTHHLPVNMHLLSYPGCCIFYSSTERRKLLPLWYQETKSWKHCYSWFFFLSPSKTQSRPRSYVDLCS